MSFTGDHPIVENVLYDVSGSAIAVTHSASLDMTTQAGVAIAGFYSSSTGFTARVLQVDDEGRLMVDAQIVPAGVQQITGTVHVEQPVAVTDNGGSLTVDGTVSIAGSVSVDDGGGSLTVDGTVNVGNFPASQTVNGTVTAQVTGTVNLDRGNDATLPLFVTGSITSIATGVQQVTGTVAISGPVTINQPVTVQGSVSTYTQGAQLVSGTVAVSSANVFTSGPQAVSGSVSVYTQGAQLVSGTVTAAVTGTVNLDRGNVESIPLWTSGSVAITNVVNVDHTIHTSASGTFFTSTTSTVTIATASSTRRGLTIYNESGKAMYIKFGAGATTTNYTWKIFADDGWTMPDFLYSGVITATWAGADPKGAQVTIVTP